MIRRATDEYGVPIGQVYRNIILDTHEFEVELENVETDKITTNQIASNLYYQLNNEGHEIF